MNSIVSSGEHALSIVSSYMKHRVHFILAAGLGTFAFFVAGGFAAVSSAPGAQGFASQLTSSGVPAWLLGFIACAGLVCAGTASVFLFSYSAMRIDINGGLKLVEVREHGRGLLLPAASFRDCRLRKETTRDGVVYRVSLVRVDGSLMTLLRLEDREEAERAAAEAKRLLELDGGRGPSKGETPDWNRGSIALPRLVGVARYPGRETVIVVRTPRNILQTASLALMLVGFAWVLFGSVDAYLGVVGAWLARVLVLVCAFYLCVAFLSSLSGRTSLTIDDHECVARHSLFGIALPFGVMRMRLEDVAAVRAGFGAFDTGLSILDKESDKLFSLDELGLKEQERLRELSRKNVRIDVAAMHYADRMTLERIVREEIEKRLSRRAKA